MPIGLHKLIKLFERENCCVTGLKGTGKDMLFANIVARRKLPYISNTDYGGDFIPYDYDATFALGGNTYRNFISGDIRPYTFPYAEGTDIYLADAGVYFPAQEGCFLDRDLKGMPLYCALSRHIGNHSIHVNVQNLERCWRKVVEQSGVYIRCIKCIYLLGYVVQLVDIYERADSCQLRVPPCPYRPPLICPKESRQLWEMKKLEYRVAYGDIQRLLLIYRNKSTYDTRVFKTMLERGAPLDT